MSFHAFLLTKSLGCRLAELWWLLVRLQEKILRGANPVGPRAPPNKALST